MATAAASDSGGSVSAARAVAHLTAHLVAMLSRTHYILTFAILVAVCAAIADLPASAGEPLLLRWSRTCAEHPVRTSLAFTLAVRAVAGPSRSSPARDPPVVSRS